MSWLGDIEARTHLARTWLEECTLAKGERRSVGGPTGCCFIYLATWLTGQRVPEVPRLYDQWAALERACAPLGLTQIRLKNNSPWTRSEMAQDAHLRLIIDGVLAQESVRVLEVIGAPPGSKVEHVLGLVRKTRERVLWVDSLAPSGLLEMTPGEIVPRLRKSFGGDPGGWTFEAIAERKSLPALTMAGFGWRPIAEGLALKEWLEESDDFL